MNDWRTGMVMVWLAALALAGCARTESNDAASAGGGQAVTKTVHTHDGWWCDEHGVPEEVCARCDTTLVDDFKAKQDWCDQHNRPASQCFVCDATRQERFAAQYQAKFGRQPPPVVE